MSKAASSIFRRSNNFSLAASSLMSPRTSFLKSTALLQPMLSSNSSSARASYSATIPRISTTSSILLVFIRRNSFSAMDPSPQRPVRNASTSVLARKFSQISGLRRSRCVLSVLLRSMGLGRRGREMSLLKSHERTCRTSGRITPVRKMIGLTSMALAS